jgi:hypothetical protein
LNIFKDLFHLLFNTKMKLIYQCPLGAARGITPDSRTIATPEVSRGYGFFFTRLWRLVALTLLWLSVLASSSLQAQMVTNTPTEAPGALSNPLMGFRPDRDNYSQYPYPTVVREYIAWNAIENHANDTVQKIRDYCNSRWSNLPTNNVKVIPRVYIDWDSNSGNEHWPADLTPGDWSSQAFKDRVVRLVGRLGEVWDNDPRVAWVQTGIIGYWGEQESPVGIGQDGWAQRLGNAFTNAFKNKMLIVRNMGDWPGYEMGVYWDSFGHPSQAGVRNTIKSFNDQGRHLTRVVEGEVAYNWGEATFDPLYGGDPDVTFGNPQYTDNMIDVIRELHCSALGWIASYSPNNPTVSANAARMQKEFGYRFAITEFACSARTERGANLDVRFKVKNTGSAPCYENWPVAVVLINEATRQIVWKATLPNTDVRTWQPGHNYSTSTRSYQTPAQEHQIAASVPIPAGLAAGQYLVGLSILEPLSRTPGIFFAVSNFFKQSQSQPLCRIGIGMNASSHTLTGVAFDDLVNDDKRYYTMNSVGPNHTLTLQSSSQGGISPTPGGGSYVKDTGVQVTANGNLGYAFASWGGALAGLTNNPAIVVMDANKTIAANYVSVPTYTLATGATNGSITLNPPGGVYNAGTVVTATAIPNRGYVLGSWGGDHTGSTNPTTITMNGDKSVTANFAVFNGDRAPWLEAFTLANGTKTDGTPTSWTATRSTGLFEVSSNRLMINGGSTEGVFETAEISTGGGSVKVSLEVQSQAVDSQDYVRFYKIVDGGTKVPIGQLAGAGTNTMVGTGIVGNKLKLRIETRVSFGTEYYYFDNLKVEDEVPLPTYTLTTSATNGAISLNPAGGVYDEGTVVTVTAIPGSGYSFTNWSGDLSGSLNPTNITMNGNKSATANFNVRSNPASFYVNGGGAAYVAPGGIVFEADGIYNSGGGTHSTTSPISGTTDDALYQSERFGSSFSYQIPLTNGNYEVTLMFAEIFFNAAGSRVFNVAIEGTQVISNLDIWSKVGKDAVYNETHVATVTDGQLDIAFNPVVENPKISAIKVERLTGPVSYTLTTSATNGAISLNPPGGIYTNGTVVTLTAMPSNGYTFVSWSGNLTGSTNPVTLTMNGNRSVTANFIMPQPGYPYAFTYNGNPLVRNHGAADPDVHVWDGVVWLYCSQDHAPNYDNMDGYHAFSSTNLIDWVDHGEILHSRDVSWGTNGFMWAPGAARANGQYYLYYPHKDKAGSWKIGVATSPVPQGPFTDIGAPMAGIGGIDPAIFIDDDGQAYIYNNNHIVAKLKPNMIELAEATRSINYGPQAVTTDTYLQFNEGSYMHKRNGVYYYSYSNFKNSTNQAFYGMGTNPYGPFEWKGPMAVRPTGAQDHHSVMEFQGQWYYFYHVALPDIPAVKDGQSRIACFDKMYYNPDGTIQVVDLTLGPVGGSATNFQVNCGGSAFTAGDGTVFEADGTYNYGGSGFSTSSAISGTTDDALYQTERFGGSFNYSFPVGNGDYDVTLMFAEINFNTAGSRVFHVAIEGTQVITNLDIWAKVGKDAAYNETHRVTVSDGQLNIAFSTVVNNAKIAALKVQRIQASLPITIQPPVLQGGQLRLEWTGGGTLQTATNVVGPWNVVSNAVSPYLSPTTNAEQFFRVQQ